MQSYDSASQHGFVPVPIQLQVAAAKSSPTTFQQELYRIAFERARSDAEQREWFELLGDYCI